MTEPGHDDDLRVGTQEREQVVVLLQQAVGDGYLDLAEFDERSRQALAARTRGELRAVVLDLPAAQQLFPRPAPTAVAASTGERLDIAWKTVRRNGVWMVPDRLVIEGSAGTADLDLREAVIPPGGVVIEVHAAWSTVRLRLGPHLVVRDEMSPGGWSSVKLKAGPPTTPSGPTVVLRGQPSATTVVVRR